MTTKDLNDTLRMIGAVPAEFRRDTGLLLTALDRLQETQRELSQAIYDCDKELVK